jgi:hypothetical protein
LAPGALTIVVAPCHGTMADMLSPDCTVTKAAYAVFEKVTMILSPNYAATLLLAGMPLGLAMATIPTSAHANDYATEGMVQAAERCATYGAGYIDMGHGTCGRVHVRVDTITRNGNAGAWTAGGTTSSAALRSDGAGMVPGAGIATHLRVRNGLDSYSPFR